MVQCKDFRQERACINYFYRRLTKKKIIYYTTLIPPDDFLPKLNNSIRGYLTERYESVNSFFKYHSEVFKVNKKGRVFCGSYKQLDEYFTNVLPQKILTSNEMLLEQYLSFHENNSTAEPEDSSATGATNVASKLKRELQVLDNNTDLLGASGATSEVLSFSEGQSNIAMYDNTFKDERISEETVCSDGCNESGVFRIGNIKHVLAENITKTKITSNINSGYPRLWRSFAMEKRLIKVVQKSVETSGTLVSRENILSLFSDKLNDAHCSYFTSTYSSIQEFLSFHSDIFQVDENGLIHCASKKVITNYLNSSCYHKAFFPDLIQNLEKQCILKLCKALHKNIGVRYIHDPVLKDFFSTGKQKLKDFFVETYTCMEDFLLFHYEIFFINSSGDVSCAIQEDIVKYINGALSKSLKQVDYHYSRIKLTESNYKLLQDPSPCFEMANDKGNCGRSEKKSEGRDTSNTDVGKIWEATQIPRTKEASTQTVSTGPILSMMQLLDHH